MKLVPILRVLLSSLLVVACVVYHKQSHAAQPLIVRGVVVVQNEGFKRLDEIRDFLDAIENALDSDEEESVMMAGAALEVVYKYFTDEAPGDAIDKIAASRKAP